MHGASAPCMRFLTCKFQLSALGAWRMEQSANLKFAVHTQVYFVFFTPDPASEWRKQ